MSFRSSVQLHFTEKPQQIKRNRAGRALFAIAHTINNQKERAMHYRIYKDTQGYWRWRLKATNGKIIADSGESYYNKSDCRAGIELVKNSKDAPVYEDD